MYIMKKPVQKFGFPSLLFALIFLIIAACSKDETPDVKTNNSPPKTDGVEQDSVVEVTEDTLAIANKITQSLKFRNGQVIKGSLPTTKGGKSTMVDFKIDTDTIFWVEGITNRIKIRKPDAPIILVGTFWAQVEGSDSYVKAEFEKEQENDTILILNFDFDITEWEPPFSFNMKFVLADDTGTKPITTVGIPVEIEKPFDGGQCIIVDQSHWDWIYTTLNGEYLTGPMHYATIDGTIEGCCTNGVSYSGGACFSSNPDRKILDYKTAYVVSRDFFKFQAYGPFISGSMQELANNFDPVNTDFCGESVSYTDSNKGNIYAAEVDQSNCSFTLENMSGREEEIIEPITGASLGFLPLPIYMGSGPSVEYKFISPHFIKEVRNNLEGGPEGAVERVYERRNADLFNGAWWYPAN